jgi:hypothetical protein
MRNRGVAWKWQILLACFRDARSYSANTRSLAGGFLKVKYFASRLQICLSRRDKETQENDIDFPLWVRFISTKQIRMEVESSLFGLPYS